MQTAEPKIEVIIPNWNGSLMLQHCLRSLASQSFKNFTVTVVDNGSTDDTEEVLVRDYPDVQLIKFDHNTGFSVAVNAGIKQSTAPLILLLNNDMEVAPDCLQLLYDAAENNYDFEFFALKMVSFHDRDVLDGAGDVVLRGGVGYRLGTLEMDGDVYSSDREVFGACAGAALYRRRFFSAVGLFDEDFFAYLEDVDLNIRGRRLGLRCLYLHEAVVYHIGSATSGSKINPLTIRLSTRNNLNLLIKNYPLSYFVRFAPALLVYQCMWFLFCCKKLMLVAWFKGVLEAVSMFSRTKAKRTKLLTSTSRDWHTVLANQIKDAERMAVDSIMRRRSEQGKGNVMLQVYCKLFL
ncbi:glycosyltransferase family 2 protein [Desulforhopalus sp. 52FAK]